MLQSQLKSEEINADVFIKATEMLRLLFPHFSEGWIKQCQDRILDVEYLGKEKGADVFHVKRNFKFDGEDKGERGKSWSYRKVILRSKTNHWCSDMFGPFSWKRRKELCSHIGTCILFRFYFQILESLEGK